MPLWKDCSTLVSAPDDYFPESVKSGTTLAYLFQNCSALENVPAGLFRNFESVTIITQMFENCTSLRSLPVEMFDNMRKITTATSAFNGCSAFTGESPYTMVEGEKVHLYERSTANGFSAVTKYTDCFEGCTQMADYANIPQAWGGISDGTKAKPTLTLSMAPQAGAEYYRFDITIRGTEVKQSKFVLGTTEIVQKRLAEFDGDYERLCNRYGTTFNSSVVFEKINPRRDIRSPRATWRPTPTTRLSFWPATPTARRSQPARAGRRRCPPVMPTSSATSAPGP